MERKISTKKECINFSWPFLRTSGRKFFNTSAPVTHNTLTIGSNKPDISKFEKSEKLYLNLGILMMTIHKMIINQKMEEKLIF